MRGKGSGRTEERPLLPSLFVRSVPIENSSLSEVYVDEVIRKTKKLVVIAVTNLVAIIMFCYVQAQHFLV